MTKQDVAELLHVNPDVAYYEIRKLVKAEELKSAKRGPDAHYVLSPSVVRLNVYIKLYLYYIYTISILLIYIYI